MNTLQKFYPPGERSSWTGARQTPLYIIDAIRASQRWLALIDFTGNIINKVEKMPVLVCYTGNTSGR